MRKVGQPILAAAGGCGQDCPPHIAFDAIAARYDELWTATADGHSQRDLVWRNIDGLFRRGERLLDIGCGTGADAAHFSARGIDVHAVDASPAMVREAQRRGGFRVSVRRAEEVGEMGETFDGAISNFGPLNCVADLAPVARGLARVVRPGGHLAICVIGRFCLWETLRYTCRGQFGKAFRRVRGRAGSSMGITVFYPTVRQLAAAFAPGFKLLRWMGIGRVPRWLTHLPLVRAMADHRLLIFERH